MTSPYKFSTLFPFSFLEGGRKYLQFITSKAQTLPHWCSALQLKIFLQQLTKLTVTSSKWTRTTKISLKIQSITSQVHCISSLPCREIHLALPAINCKVHEPWLSLWTSHLLNCTIHPVFYARHHGRHRVSFMPVASVVRKDISAFIIS